MPDKLDGSIVDSVSNTNFKSLAEMGVTMALAHQNRLNILAEKSLARSLEAMDNLSVGEGLGIAAANRGDLAKHITDLGAAIAGLQEIVKGAQTTPPVTA